MPEADYEAMRERARLKAAGMRTVAFPTGGPGAIRTARRVPELRTWMVRQWAPAGLFTTVTEALAHIEPGIVFADLDAVATEYAAVQHDAAGSRLACQRAEMYYVEPEMVDLLAALAPSTPDDVTPNDLPIPAPEGLMVFATPVMGTASDLGYPIEVQAILWHPTVLPGGIHSVSIENYRQGWPDHDDAEASEALGDVWFPLGRSDWPIADTVITRPAWAPQEERWASFLEDRRLLTAIFTLLAEEGLTSRIIQRPDRPTIKRAAREGVTATSNVIVANLRAPRYEPSEAPAAGTTHHSHRWLVREHLRWQPVGPGRTERRLTVVRAHTRGPADAPLVMKDKVNRWVR